MGTGFIDVLTHVLTVKAPPRDPENVSPPVASDKTYREILESARTRQLELTATNLQRLAETYDQAAKGILETLRSLPDGDARRGSAWLQAQLNAVRDIDEQLTALRRDYGTLLDLSMLSSAQDVADREHEIETLVDVSHQPNLVASFEKSVTLSDGVVVGVRYGTLAQGAVEATAARYYSDGLKLSDRLYSLDLQSRKVVEDVLLQGIAQRTSARDIAKNLEDILAKAGAANPRYRAMTIAQSEINAAFRESAIRATVDPGTGNLKSYIDAIGWRLSASHKDLDRCDLYANDEGANLGPGNYLPGDVPTSHPRCLCAVVSILAAYPDEQFVRKQPDAAGVPESEVRRLVEKEGDPVAQRWLARLSG